MTKDKEKSYAGIGKEKSILWILNVEANIGIWKRNESVNLENESEENTCNFKQERAILFSDDNDNKNPSVNGNLWNITRFNPSLKKKKEKKKKRKNI